MGIETLFVVSLIATGVSFVEQRNAAKAARIDAKAQAKQEETRFRGELITRKQKFIEQSKANIAASAASGIDPFSGSSAQITEEGFRRFDLESLTAQASSDATQDSIKRTGRQRESAANTAAAGSLLNFASQQSARGTVPTGGQTIS